MIDAAGSGRAAGGVFQLLVHRLDQHRVVAGEQRAEFVDRMRQGAGQRAAEIGDADPLGAGIGLDPQGHDRALAVRVFRRAGERLVGRQFDDLRRGPGNFHRVTIGFGLSGRVQPKNLAAVPLRQAGLRLSE